LNREKLARGALIAGFILAILAIYCYPALKTAAVTRSRILPTISAPDVSLYLNISNIRPTPSGQIVDPYYGVPISVARMGYLKFRTAFLLFSMLNHLLHQHLGWSLFLWNLFWWGFLCVIAWWFFDRFLPGGRMGEVAFAIGLLLLFNFGTLQNVLAAWRHLPSLSGFYAVELPFIRPFFPQIPTPLVILYLGLQIEALRKSARWAWAGLAVIQFLAFTIFPYAMLMMAALTGFALLGLSITKRRDLPWLTIMLYSVACGVADSIFLLYGGGSARSGAPGQYSLIHIDLSVLPHRIGGTWLLLALLSAAVVFVRELAPELRWSLAGLGVANLLLLIGDVFFSETALQMSQHGGYFVQMSAAILFSFLIAALAVRLRTPMWKFALFGAAFLLLVNGIFVAQAAYRHFLPENQELTDLARVLQSDRPQADDLVITTSLSVDDACAWVPLITSSHVLFCRNAQVLLTPDQNEEIQRFRQALYLYFTNRDEHWVEGILDDPSAVTELTRLMFLGQVTTDPAERQRGIDGVRMHLVPLLAKAGQQDAEMRTFFAQYHRVIVIDENMRPYFDESRLSDYVRLNARRVVGSLRVMEGNPR
jgi:hypothetical protein